MDSYSVEEIEIEELKLNGNDLSSEMKDLYSIKYGAEFWLNILTAYTIPSKLLAISDNEAHDIVYDEKLSDRIIKNIDFNYEFVKSSKKSSHKKLKCKGINDYLEELTDANVKMTFKKGCRYILFRKWINIKSEFRLYIHNGIFIYMENYTNYQNPLIRFEVLKFFNKFEKLLTYRSYVVDIALLDDDSFVVIEINTPMYLYGGLQLGNYAWESDYIHNLKFPIYRYKNDGELIELGF
jgi:hypothetical protein